MSEQPQATENLADQFRELGKNLVETLRAAWESPERQRLQEEIETGLNDMAATIRTEVDTFGQSPTGQRLKSDVDNLRTKISSGEAENELRDELLKALRMINAELEQAAGRWRGTTPAAENTPAEPGEEPD